jgi:hypothetical protein
MPYLQVVRDGYSSTFILFVVDNEIIQHRVDYQEHISALWSVNVPVHALADCYVSGYSREFVTPYLSKDSPH